MNSTLTVLLPSIIFLIVFIIIAVVLIRYAKSKIATTAVITVGLIIMLFIIFGVYPIVL
ncbi:membrane protein YdbS with pleckstrin-like domain [Cytobacillus horneckiae]|uniref:hypothetical protein n=1 Tax=Cytobacillus horneckiae TaxID=549687 RepID=UPI000AE7FE00|nr:hypothetical protein [Cytobacillus horneckiae]NRG48372.1 hypothetical protein [Bacillus sp. CRN 9]MBN6887389.1 hypothetical protein [Cytobacillus horneckiae]MCM3178020.1 hypothetical protein [Cytobacillus horneckiae]MEC1157241.1 hypothetical protein [Cytobacillus horneckiae]MED2938174.1 hypothetical protein [Cytobacillus horneckiae]